MFKAAYCKIGLTIGQSRSRPAPKRLALCIRLLLVSPLLLLSFAAQAQTAQYFYDGAGRLTGMFDPAKGSAQYTYDATGNIKAVVNNALSAVTVLQFSPSAAPVGAVVTISGTGFSAETSVGFNGVAATPSQASATSLTVAIPVGATSGPLSVTAPGGSATSAGSFTVSSTLGPTITGVSPSPIIPGQTLTIIGSNFVAGGNVDYNRVFINNRFAEVLTATAGKITALVPNVGSGPVSVQTPSGAATFNAPLAVAPSIPWNAATQCTPGPCVFTAQFSAGAVISAQTVTLPAPGSSVTSASLPAFSFTGVGPPPVALISFFAPAGQRVAISIPASLGQSAPPTPLGFSLLSPDGWNPLPESDLPFARATGFQTISAAVTVQLTGTQTIALYVPSANKCSPAAPCAIPGVAVTLHNVPPDVTATIAPSVGGTSVPIIFQGSGQSAVVSFQQAPPSDLVSVVTTPNLTPADPGLTNGACYLATITQPELTHQIDFQCGRGANAVDFSGQLATPAPGTYTLTVTPLNPIVTAAGVSTATLTLYSIASAFTPIPIVVGGPGQTLNMAVNGQAGLLTFNGAAGQKLTLTTQLQNDSIGQCAGVGVTYQSDVYTVTGVSAATQCSTTGGSQLFTLPVAGAYAITISPDFVPSHTPAVPALQALVSLAATPAAPALAQAVAEPTLVATPSQAIQFGGPAVDLVIAAPGSSASARFQGEAGQGAEVVAGADAAFGAACFFVKTLAPDGTPLLDERSCDGSYSSGIIKLTASGTYQVFVHSDGEATGRVWLHVGRP